jgi:acetoin utilization deacetylase AcuC-like enzyme
MLTGIVRDDRYLDHMPGHAHPEHPSRLRAIYEALDRLPTDRLLAVDAEFARLEDLELVHTPTYVKKVMKTAEQTFTSIAPDTPVCAKSYLAAWLAVGGCLRGLDALMDHRCEACFCLVRPPGHHALADRAGGFCIFNNLALTARYAARQYRIERTLIIDFDIHHGNGLQDIFYTDPGVLYFSTHDMLLYPYSGDLNDAGKGAGAGFTVNIPLSRDFEDNDLYFLYSEILPRIMKHFRPELVLVAAGFDALAEDPIGRSHWTPQGIVDLVTLIRHTLVPIGRPPLLLSLEGGYNARTLADAVVLVLDALAMDRPLTIPAQPPATEVQTLVQQVIAAHRALGVWR